MKIGISHIDYPIVRNIYRKVSSAEYVVLKKNNNLFHTLSTIKNIVTRKKIIFEGKYFFYNQKTVDVLHLYNDINYSKKKWVTTFETLVPRFLETKNDHQKEEPSHKINLKTKVGLRKIAAKNCLGIIAISQASANIQLKLLKNYPQYSSKIAEKLHVIHPPQEIISENINKNYDKLKLIFVGTQFHLKGGVEMIEVLTELKKKYNFELIIISSFKTDNYVTKVSQKEAEETETRLEKLSWIKLYKNIPNEKVLELIQESHVGLLPTWSDTYGFSVLEMQACGIPVITTNIRALPEINNQNCGWLIEIPQNRLKQALYFTENQKETLKKSIKQQLNAILIDIFENKSQIKEKAIFSLERIKKQHNPEQFAQKLVKIYHQ